MSFKIFPTTYGGDQLRIVFTDSEEKAAFERAVEQLKLRILDNRPRETPIADFKFATTLEECVAQDNIDELRLILGTRVFNVYSKDSCYIVPLPQR